MWFSAYRVDRLFLWSLLFGAAAGAYYDIFRIIRIARKPRGDGWKSRRFLRYGDAVLCFAGDILYWLTLAAAYCVFIYDAADGRLRIASLIAVAGGFLVWFFTLGRLVAAAADMIIYAVRLILKAVFRVTVVPAAKALRFIFTRIAGAFRAIRTAIYSVLAVRLEKRRAARGYGLLRK